MKQKRTPLFNKYMFPGSLAILLLLTTAGYADVLTRGTKKMNGRFAGIEKSRFHFEGKSGQIEKTHQSFVTTLELDEPIPVRFVQSGKKGEQTGMLYGYRSGKFAIILSGKKQQIPGTQIKQLSIRNLEEEQQAGAVAGNNVPTIDSRALRQRKDLTANQSATLDRYDRAKQQYDAYLTQSSAMVAKMDAAKGGQRGKLLIALRHRKAEEQPLKNTFEASRDALLAAFPNAAAQSVRRTKGKAPTLTLRIPNYKEGTIVLIDTGFLENSGPINPDQKNAIKKYNSAKNKYAKYAAQPPPDSEATKTKLSKNLLDSQSSLFGAFPNLEITN